MRRFLDSLYRLGGYISALQLMVIMVMVVLQVFGRILDKALLTLGMDALGLQVPGLAELAGFLLLGATFTGLAYTLTVGGHIRVDLLHRALPEKVQRALDIVVVVIALAITTFATWFSVLLTYDSYDFGDVSIGMVPVPLWIPQAVMVVGLVWLLIALLDALVGLITGRITHLKDEAPQE
ncbi:TRAP-type C4-dicarboxylate transport system permease small subunit [Marinobacter pelagius]|uniref:TRAP transporter small permease protein n=1 Tax=Marinobacter pelagius TaxID=379482 RepID=A0A366GL61_9GAMM|nr:TRAP transporter small permease [Marinobacter pelagius]RBP27813.1 TRAP-type C4-dicarboxylate transport system permease small subunit [Marinobacter pelagius]